MVRQLPTRPVVELTGDVVRLLVDGMNVIGSRPDGWWRDRDGAARRLFERLRHLAAESDDELTLVLDGRPLDDLPEGTHHGVEVLYARRPGRNAGDDRIVEALSAAPDATAVCVVMSDRDLTRRARALGAETAGARSLLGRLDRLPDDGPA
ncbi:MAG TPA: NYN domain-containing protein [Acidimicrobiia bacterium]|nr:NYN domain-containing protein [Acidimicrobiia bacterium]